jgi:ATP-dependent protease ClpP protease subunit
VPILKAFARGNAGRGRQVRTLGWLVTDNLPDADFTPNADRAIWIDGELDELLLDHLRPEILELTAQSRQPITVFIHNGGGNTEVRDEILRLVRATTPDDPRSSRIITVAASYAASAGAHLLSAGDFAIASLECRLLYHGERWPLSDLVAAGEAGKLYARTLPTFHERNAKALARNSARRFLFIVSAHRSLFPEHRADAGRPGLTDLECFQAMLGGKLSRAGQRVVERAISLYASQDGLMLHFRKGLRRGRTVTMAHLQKLMRHASSDFEDRNNKGKTTWDAGLGNIADHFFSSRNISTSEHSPTGSPRGKNLKRPRMPRRPIFCPSGFFSLRSAARCSKARTSSRRWMRCTSV